MPVSILVVEDDVAMREGVCEILIEAGYQVSVASNGEEALEILPTVSPQLIISDIMMPKMNGWKFYERVREDDKWLKVPFIFLTAKGEKKDIIRGKSMGVDDYLTKPFDPEELLAAVESKLARMNQLVKTSEDQARQLADQADQLEQLADQLTRSDRLATIGEMIAEFAHEIKNPLTAITAYAQFVQRRMVRKEPEAAQDMERIVRQAKRIAKMAEDILSYTRKDPLKVRETDIHHLLDETIAFISFRLEKEGVKVETFYDSNIPLMLVDPDQVEQVFLNIIINATHAMEKGGLLTISTTWLYTSKVPTARISFADTGGGISPENLRHLFEPYFTTRPAGKGTGLGLHVCQRIVEKHGGHIEVESQEGDGATFHVYLPMRTNHANGADIEQPVPTR